MTTPNVGGNNPMTLSQKGLAAPAAAAFAKSANATPANKPIVISLPALFDASMRDKDIFNPLFKSLSTIKNVEPLTTSLKGLQNALNGYDSNALGIALRKPFGYKISDGTLQMNKAERNTFVATLANKLNAPNSENSPVPRVKVLVIVLTSLSAYIEKRKAAGNTARSRFKVGGEAVKANIVRNKNVRALTINKAIQNLSAALAIVSAAPVLPPGQGAANATNANAAPVKPANAVP